jgi:hypothetical protein
MIAIAEIHGTGPSFYNWHLPIYSRNSTIQWTQKFLNPVHQNIAPNTTMHQSNPLQIFWSNLIMIYFKTAILFTLTYPNCLHPGFPTKMYAFHFTNMLHMYYALDM